MVNSSQPGTEKMTGRVTTVLTITARVGGGIIIGAAMQI